jgi:4-amino-4-deoxy-L-arabinose transferase-like glycosyltransferase
MIDGAHGYFYVNAVFYYLFGLTDIPIKLLNAFIGVLVTRHVFFLARDLFGPQVARTTGLLANYFPSLVLWSALNIRDI